MKSDVKRKEHGGAQTGFTLIELLVVMVILGMIAVLMTVAVSNALKRQRLDTAAQQLSSTIQKAYVDTSLNQREVFVQISAAQSDGSRTLNLVDDSNGNGKLDTTDKVVESYKITGDLALSNSSTAATAWPVVNGDMVIGCDAVGRAADPTTSLTMKNSVLLSLTHKEMLSGTLSPKIRYDIQIFPIWKTTMTKARY